MRIPVLSTRRLLPAPERLLRRSFTVTGVPEKARGILTQVTDTVDSRAMDRSPRLEVISQCAVGVDNIDLREAARRGITVMNTPDVLTEATADLTWALILAAARRLPEADRLCRSGRDWSWDLELLLGRELSGGVLGIVGLGRIGHAVARRGAGFGMRIVYARRSRRPPSDPAYRRTGLRRLLSISDVVTIHVPSTPATFHLIGRDQIALMKPSAILVNTSRGPILDETALIGALRRGRIWNAGLDVFEREPHVPDALRSNPRVVLTPHIGSATTATREAMAMTAVGNLVAYFAGRPDARRIAAGAGEGRGGRQG